MAEGQHLRPVTIVMHSDHGSRIYQHHPNADSKSELSDADYLDSFSTLFAVKGPRHPPGYDRRVAPLEQLLGEVVGGPTGGADRDPEPYVLLLSDRTQRMLRQPPPAFGDEQ